MWPRRQSSAKSRPRILLTEGSSLSAREAITALGLAGHRVAVCGSSPLCMGRFSRFVVRHHVCPPVSRDAVGYVRAVARLITDHRYNVLCPVHEQAYVLAQHRTELPPVQIALASAASFDRVQSKAALVHTLRALCLPQPATQIATCAAELREASDFPYYVKTAFGTASSGVTRVNSRQERDALASQLEADAAFDEGVIVQQPAGGQLERVQAVFQQGRLVAIHAYRQIREAIRGGDVVKESIRRALVREQVERLGRFLNWHGALSLDYFWSDRDKARYIDANPRLVEPMNAVLSGVNLAEILVRVSLGEAPDRVVEGAPGVRTRLTLMGILTRAAASGSRRAVLRELADAFCSRGDYAGTVEELTPLRFDPRSLIPLAFVSACALIKPKLAAAFAADSVDAYALAGRTGAAREHLRFSPPRLIMPVIPIPAGNVPKAVPAA